MKNTILFANQSLTRFTAEIFANILQNILRIFFVTKNRSFYTHCEQMVDCRYSQVERVLRKLSIYILEYFSNMQGLPLVSLDRSKSFRFIHKWYTKSKIGFPTNLQL